ncbi:P-loop containing nucleoside triphosphate hydrolase protein [Serendipita vermifera]|nr:P-loop containing nucleoside triphosphate hydrolase protein [Serendipita vermifera]
MSLDTESFFLSPPRATAPEISQENINVDDFFGEPMNFRGGGPNGAEDALTDGTSLHTRGTTPALSDGWMVEEGKQAEDDVAQSNEDLEDAFEPELAPFGQSTTNLPPIMAYSYDGKPVVIGRRSPRNKVVPKRQGGSDAKNTKSAISQLINLPLYRMMEQLSKETASKLEISLESSPYKGKGKEKDVEEVLWTDKYRPRHFTDLLGDERVHRDAMSWVKEWDDCVFPERAANKRKKVAREGEEQFVNFDEYRRPREKILLLSGPPGLGKTTLAHVIARQAGYAVMEINASDARTGNIIEDRIRPVLEAGTAVGGSKPVLVIIDEIDGATGGGDNNAGFVQRLVNLTMAKPKKKGRSKDKKDNRRPLLRPIICICNDLYASSLAKLRPISRIVRFQKPATVHLVKRLKDICEMESLKADSRSLTALVGVAQGDMRGCLNTLQLLKAKHAEITEGIVRKATVGMKESESSFMDVITDIFTPLSKTRVKDLGLTSEEEARYVNRISRTIDSTGNLDRVALACFEHYPLFRVHDANFNAYEKAHDWLSHYDTFSVGMLQDREYALLPYLPYTLTPFHPLFATKGGPKLERPKMDWEAFQKQKTFEEIYKTLSRNVLGDPTSEGKNRRGGHYRHLVANPVLQLEFAPLLNRIISPPLKPVNKQVIKTDEKLLMSRVVDIMVCLDLRFVQEKQEDGTLVYRLDPPIDVFVTYDDKRAADIAISRYATRHLIAAEIDAQIIEQHAQATEETTKPTVASIFTRKEIANDTGSSPVKNVHDQEAPSSPPMPARKRKREEPEIDIADKPAVDFFGRLVTPKVGASEGITAESTIKRFKVSYKFNEGMSAAVRKPVKLSSLLM